MTSESSPQEVVAVSGARRDLVYLIQARRRAALAIPTTAEVAAAEESATARLDAALAAFDGELATAYANVVGELRRTAEWLDDSADSGTGGRMESRDRAREIRRVLDGAAPAAPLAPRAADSAETSDAVAGAASRVLALADDFLRDVKSAAASVLRQVSRKGEGEGAGVARSEADELLDAWAESDYEVRLCPEFKGWEVGEAGGEDFDVISGGDTPREALRAAFSEDPEAVP